MIRAAVALLLVVAVSSCSGRPGGEVADSGIRGRVVRAPTCPVETEASPCPPEGVATTVVIEATGGEVHRVETQPDGTFRIGLPPGRYLVRAIAPSGSRLAPVPHRVIVEAASVARVTVILDTGLRAPGR